MIKQNSRRPIIAAGMTLGVGLGGFFDGIVFHQLLQMHNMLSARFPPINVENIEINMFWDGLFHAFCWIVSLLGLTMLWCAVKQPTAVLDTRTFVGSLLGGFGVFNIVEGIIDHHILHLHHVKETADHFVWDVGFLVTS